MKKRNYNPNKYDNDRKQKQQAKEFEEPPLLGLITRLFRGIKFDIRNIHIRYEDELFSEKNPISFGFTIQNIKLDT